MFHFGVDYYPEQWPEDRWPLDADLMVRAGITCVRLAEFSWGVLEPAEGTFDFGWLDRAIDLVAGRGLKVVLGTPTASPPSWLMHADASMARVREDGRAVTYGNRRGYCPSHAGYRAHCRRIVTAMADRYGSHPAVIGWQIDNEMGDRCFCAGCRAAFQQWLAARHGSLENLNRRWGTAFWGHLYRSWDHVPLPLSAGDAPNPGLALDFRRFASDVYADFQRQQVDVIRPRSPDRFVTHNFMGFGSDTLDQHQLARDLDIASWDNYPCTQWHPSDDVDPAGAALSHDTTRGLKPGGFCVMEQQAGPAGWELVGVPPRPGELALWAWQSIARGADAVVFFRWRTARFGTEQYWHGLLDHDGSETRRYREISAMGAALAAVGPAVAGTAVAAEAALLVSPDARFSQQIQATNPGLDYNRHFAALHRSFYHTNVAVDVAWPGRDLSGYRLIAAPLFTVANEADVGRLEAYVRAGGTLLLTFRAGTRDPHNAVVDARPPGLLRNLCGAEVEEYDSLPPGGRRGLRFLPRGLGAGSGVHRASWCEVLRLQGAEPLAVYTDGHYRGRPAAAMHRLGAGRVIYLGVAAEQPLYDALVPWLCRTAGVRPVLRTPPGVEATERRTGGPGGGGRRLLFLLNHSDRPARVRLGTGRFTDLLDDGRPLAGAAVLPPLGVRVLATGAGDPAKGR
jgi:beta-galactosidase